MSNKLVDDAALWHQSRNSQIQDFEAPEPEPEEPSFLMNEEPETTEQEYITDREVKTELNMMKLNEPTAEIIVAMMDVVLPLVLVILIKGTDKQDVKLEDSERETLITAWAQYLKTTSFNLSPGGVLLTSILTIYGAKVTVAMMNKGRKESEIDELRKQNELLKQYLDGEAENRTQPDSRN